MCSLLFLAEQASASSRYSGRVFILFHEVDELARGGSGYLSEQVSARKEINRVSLSEKQRGYDPGYKKVEKIVVYSQSGEGG